MSIQKRILLIFIVSFALLMLLLFAASHFFLLDRFEALERRDVRQNVLRLLDALHNDQVALDQKVNDWANWDDTYRFIADGNRQYNTSNLMDDTFKGLKLNLILYLNNPGRIVYGKFFDIQSGKEMPDMDATRRFAARQIQNAFTRGVRTGILILPQGPLVFSAGAILTSEKKGPRRGILAMGYFLNKIEIHRLFQITHLQGTVEPYRPSRGSGFSGESSGRAVPAQTAAIVIRVINEQHIGGYGVINDLTGKAALLVRITQPRIIYNQGVASITYYTLAIFFIGIALISLVLIYLKRIILDRLASFNECVDRIAASNDLTIRIPRDGDDELAKFADVMNRMMANLQLSDEGLRRYQVLSEQLHDIILFVETGGKIVDVNAAAVKAYGYTREELVGQPIFTLLGSQKITREQWQQAHQTGILVEGIHYRKDGSSFPVEVNLRGIVIGNRKMLFSLARDISERKQAEQALKESEEKFRLVFHNNTDSIFVEELTDADDLKGIVEVNETACRVWGYSRDEFLKMSSRDIDTRENMAQMDSVYEELRQKGSAVLERVGLTKNNIRINVEIAVHRFILNGKPVLLSVIRDITERKQTEDKLRHSMDQLQYTLKAAINALASATEMRDPYTAGHQERVARFALAIATEMGLPEEQKEGIHIASVVHDIGKLAIPAEILSKPTKLSATEYAMIKIHPGVGYTILSKIKFPWPIAEIVHQHHERLDGSGYQRGLAGQDILLEAKIICVADVVEAISSHRPYRPALGMDKALEEITLKKGTLYDAAVVEACRKLIMEGKLE